MDFKMKLISNFKNRFGKHYVALVQDKSGTVTNQAVFQSPDAMNAWFKKHMMTGLFVGKDLVSIERTTFDDKPVVINYWKLGFIAASAGLITAGIIWFLLGKIL
jgi:hypothetical protein